MWRFNPFGGKDHTGLEGRTIDVGNVKITVRDAIAEGGFSCVYAARDAVHPSKNYALKHMFCRDTELLDVVMKEIQVMKLLKGHPNIVTLVAHSIVDMGCTKEAILVMEFCNKSLVGLLESRGAAYFEEKQALVIFRDVCNAVFAMHAQSPPIAHRDLKAENVLLGSDGEWKLCDFGSSSTKHKCFDKPEEMGVEEDNIRKYTTPAYRAPEMWDLYRRETINEKVDIWALGCLLYRICYLKLPFDGESKLQILNGNYRIPELPKYSSNVTRLIKDMLEGSPTARPDITQVWFRVNEQLPIELRKSLPDGDLPNIGVHSHFASSLNEGARLRTTLVPQRSPPLPPGKEQMKSSPNDLQNPKFSQKVAAPMGAFWSTAYAQDSQVADSKGPSFDEEVPKLIIRPKQTPVESSDGIPRGTRGNSREAVRNSASGNNRSNISLSEGVKDLEAFPKAKAPFDGKPAFQNDVLNSFVAEFNSTTLQSSHSVGIDEPRRKALEAEIRSLKDQLKKTNEEKAEITSKYEKLSAICRSQRQEIQELKRAVAETTPASSKTISRSNIHAGSQEKPNGKTEGTVLELEQGLFTSSSSSPNTQQWHAFSQSSISKGTLMANGQPNVSTGAFAGGSSSGRFSSPAATKKAETPSGWAGF